MPESANSNWCGVIGYPITHSLSPLIHRHAYEALGIDLSYRRISVAPAELAQFWKGLDRSVCAGLAVTMPHKQTIMSYLDAIDPLAGVVGAVNTVVFASQVATGFNTDVFGIAESIRQSCPKHEFRTAVILGGRATAASALAALWELGVKDIVICARTMSGPGTVTVAAHRMGISFTPVRLSNESKVLAALAQADIVISTLPPQVGDFLSGRYRPDSNQVLLDVVYDPWPSKLVAVFKTAQATVIPGQKMLLNQARQQFELQTGRSCPAGVMESALRDPLGDDSF